MKVKDLIEAIRKDGYPKIKGHYFQYESFGKANYKESDKLIGGCAFGQAAMNLGVNADQLDSATGMTGIYLALPTERISVVYFSPRSLGSAIRTLNDETSMTLAEIADYLDANLIDEDKEQEIYV